jgi:glucosamine 6-phosphate synthetase-like amidotransferase/phosphosugar isomerase protein
MNRSNIISIEVTALPVEPTVITIADTILKKNQKTEKQEFLKEIEEINWEEMKAEIEDARREALKEIEEIDWEQMKIDIKNSVNEVDWDEIKNEMKKSMVFLDSLHIELDH